MSNQKTPPLPWDRSKGEPPSSYVRFLAFRNLGPNRSLVDAYCVVAGKARKGPERPVDAPGSWKREAARWQWQTRATAWDIEMFHEYGQRAAAAMAALIEELAQAAMRALALGETIAERAEGVAIFEALAPHVSPETIAKLAAHRGRPRLAGAS